MTKYFVNGRGGRDSAVLETSKDDEISCSDYSSNKDAGNIYEFLTLKLTQSTIERLSKIFKV